MAGRRIAQALALGAGLHDAWADGRSAAPRAEPGMTRDSPIRAPDGIAWSESCLTRRRSRRHSVSVDVSHETIRACLLDRSNDLPPETR